ncbi:VCBS repeat-containing protein [Actinacidiphila bryophytorum]|uniref:VCBS repeat-containing protein n=1 Tax=Actinacidiphila bryophytorum TaxID=1436133 RepID=UPI0019618D1B|nr:VCBS repeat-containing protein [Actinacidiphila bryophytorum]MBM9438016.1 VCBS repeat-containing protein [Actinacidiphila bryophytorum]MBN6541681.1 VCBS repeat-containing protein [Actinacidiphila bryophytorum]
MAGATALSAGTTAAASEAAPSQSQSAEYDSEAFAEAASTGHRVEVVERREESAEVFANPDGSLTRRQYSTPVWSKLDGTWRRTDPTLVDRGDGTVAPASPVFGIAFSGGGSGPLATMTKGGKQLSLAWPTPLPAPVLDGSTAVYPAVLPDVDLRVVAEVDGFSEQLIVKTPAAAADPAVRSIKLGVSTRGVTLDDDAGDNLVAKDSDGTTVFSAAHPRMWQTPADPADPAARASAPRGPADAAPQAAPQNTASAAVAADVTGSTLTLTPDPAALSEATRFPLVIDPPFTGGHVEKWAVVYSAYPTEDYPNGSGWHSDNPADEPRVGYNGSGATRSFFAMNTNGLEGATVTDATFSVTETHSWGCDPAVAGATELWSSGGITTTPTWNTSTSLLAAKLDSDSFAHGNPTYCPGDQGHDFRSTALTNYVKQAAANSWGTLVLALKAADGYEYNQNSFKRFKNNPALEVTYNYAPTLDSVAAYEGSWNPAGDGNKKVGCGGIIGNSGIALTTKVTDKDGGKVTTDFQVTSDATGAKVSFSPHSDTVSSGQTASVTVPSGSLPSGTYHWFPNITDDEGTPATFIFNCTFTVDRQGPTATVTVTTADGADPAADKAPARTARQLKLSNPASDLAGFCYLMDRPLSVSGTRCSNGIWAAADSNHTATVTVTPTGWPASTLHVIAYDLAGNHSPYDGAAGSPGDTVSLPTLTPEHVYAAGRTPDTGLATADLPGDLTGDGYTDFVASDTDGKLRLYAGDGTGKVAAAKTVGTSGWTGALVAHRGDFAGFTSPTAAPDGYEDFVVRLGDGNLYLYPGDGLGQPMYYTRTQLPDRIGGSWANVLQLIAPGNIDQNPGDDLITIECTDGTRPCTQAKLFLYSGTQAAGGGPVQGRPFDTTPTEIGSGGWQGYTDLAVGDQNGDGADDLVARSPSTGQLFLYPGRVTANADGTHSYALGTRVLYGDPGWDPANRPLLTSPGNVQGTVTSGTVDEDGTPVTYKQFQPTPGSEYGDFWATTPASSTATVSYVDDAGTSQSTTCPTGCLLFYPGGPTWHRTPHLVGTGGWSSVITGIF